VHHGGARRDALRRAYLLVPDHLRINCLGCIDTQAVTYQNGTPVEAHWHAWEAFGVCPHIILYFDEQGRLVAKE
jgi:hypothetical protein